LGSARRVVDAAPINALLEGDCLRVMSEIADGSVNLILCDLPFGTTQNRWDSLLDLDALWRHYRRVLAPGGVVLLNAQGAFTARLILSNEAWFRYKFVWVKSKPTGFLNAKRQPLRKHEDICVFYPNQPLYRPQMTTGVAYSKGVRKDQHTGSYGDFNPVLVQSDGARYPTDVLYFKTAESEGTVWHPTQKPVELARYLIRTYSALGDVVMDNAFGSGSYLVAAVIEGRRFVGIEQNRDVALFKKHAVDYLQVAYDRVVAAYEATPLALRDAVGPQPQLRRAPGRE
jgi:site-specific DNA-methyltransferase (adenine-specific)/modification methylase